MRLQEEKREEDRERVQGEKLAVDILLMHLEESCSLSIKSVAVACRFVGERNFFCDECFE